jgi:3-(3-hydroxy-phenyl)propionate hydroxylase
MASSMFDVAVIGCGPVGAMAANLLGRAGLKVLVVEREFEPYPLPRAVHLDHEMMRLFQSADLLDRLMEGMRDTEGHLHVGADHGMIRFMGTAGRPRPFGWSNDYFFYQPELETGLRDALAELPQVELRLGGELVGISQETDSVSLTLRLAGQEQTALTRWVVACDGAHSVVRKALGIALDDLDFEEPWLVVDAEVDGPVRFPSLAGVPPEADLQKLSVMMCDPVRPATIVPGRGSHRRWEFMLLPGEDEAEMMRPETVARLVGPWLEGVPHRLTRAATYRFHGLIAERWRDRRVFLAGDAAHQTPPFFGQGMCHGMRDVANLAWKLALVVRGEAPDGLLETYQSERDPHVRAVIAAAVEVGRYICILDPAEAAARDVRIREAARNSKHATAADLIPPLTAGVIASGTPGAGERFIQPRLHGRGRPPLLDDLTGAGWRLFVEDALLGQAQQEIALSNLPFPVGLFATGGLGDGGEVGAWLEAHDSKAVLLRPDFYVFGTCGEDIGGLLDGLVTALRHRDTVKESAV